MERITTNSEQSFRRCKALYESYNVVLEKVKALVESNMAMKEELLRVQEDLKNMSEEEMQFLEGTGNKLQLHESTEPAHDFEDPCHNLCCSLRKNTDMLKEQIVVLKNSKSTTFSEQRKLNNSSFIILV